MRDATPVDTLWPEPTSTSRPWTRWWWLGSAVDRPTITRLLETYRAAGIGGVEITCIYGVIGQDTKNIDYLSPEWLEMIQFTIAEARRLDMQVDLPPGSGWRIGGDFVTDATAAAKLQVTRDAAGIPASIEVRPSGEEVKRPGPAGAGRTFNPFSRRALDAALEHFRPAFANLALRAQFHDSWEYTSSGCTELFDTFRHVRGYELRDHVEDLGGHGDPERHARVHYDVQLTLAEMALEQFIGPWTESCHAMGQLSRNQAHGSPGNLLDLYAAADIPETEVFRSITPDTPLISKFASSAAHVTGRSLVSSETATWLGEHFQVSLADVKLLVDNLFASGINHHVYHGTAYSPADAEWPGWLFYASTQFNPQNPIWRDFPTLNAYVTRCQSVLQASRPDSDLLVYFPVHDTLHDTDRGFGEGLHIEGVWFSKLSAAPTLRELWQQGYSFDYVSDRQIAELRVADDDVVAAGGRYRSLVVPPCRYMPVETLEHLARLADRGATILFASSLPGAVPGLSHLAERQARFDTLISTLTATDCLDEALHAHGVAREPLTEHPGLLYIRRARDEGFYYFVANQALETVDAWVPLARLRASDSHALLMDPMTGLSGTSPVQNGRVRLQLAPGASVLISTALPDDAEQVHGPYRATDATSYALAGPWQVEFIEGGPALPAPFACDELVSWTTRGGEYERFAGTARYRIDFDAPAAALEGYTLDLGQVHASARVVLNGESVSTLIGPTFNLVLPELKVSGNQLEIEVTNLAANRIRDLDRRAIEWRIFDDINFVSQDYGPFDASDWEIMPAGLLGPLTLHL